MAHKKAGGSVRNGRDSVGQRLGIKAGDGQAVNAGTIIVRQRGMTFLAGTGTGLGHDYTVFATVDGHVKFEHATKHKKRIRVLPVVEAAAAAPRTRATAKPRSTAAEQALPATTKAAKPRASAATAEAAPNATA